MKLLYLRDPGNWDGTKGGAELTMDAFAAHMPDGIEWDSGADTVVIGNCVNQPASLVETMRGKRVIRYHHDLAYHEDPKLREWLDANAIHVFTSPLHRDCYQFSAEPSQSVHVIPPKIELSAFRPNRQTRRNQKRQGVCSVATWMNPGKGAHLVTETAQRRGITVDVYGPGPFRPYGSCITNFGEDKQTDLPQIYWKYEQFLFLPIATEPFGRCVVEAWAAGCEVLTNDLVGAKHFIEEDQQALETAAEDFWELVCG